MCRRGYYWHHLWTGAIAIAIVGLGGCSGNERPKTIPISGHVTIDGQPPGESGKLFFAPISVADGYSKRPASGSFNAAGNYRVMSWAPDDGLVPGHYTVSLGIVDPGKTAIPRRYQDSTTSGLEVDVPVDQSQIEYNIELSSN